MKAFLAGLSAMLAVAALATDAPAAPGDSKTVNAKIGQCIPRVVTQRRCLGGRMVTCQYRILRNCRTTGRRCNHPNVIIPCSPAKQL